MLQTPLLHATQHLFGQLIPLCIKILIHCALQFTTDPILPTSYRSGAKTCTALLEKVEKNSIRTSDITNKFIGALLSGGGGYPEPNTPENWLKMVNGFQAAALKTRLGIPLLYGVD